MDALRKEIQRKKAQALENKQSEASENFDSQSLENKKVKYSEENNESCQKVFQNDQSANKVLNIPSRFEIIKRLRALKEPIRLFNESDFECWQRLKKIEVSEPEIFNVYKNDLKDAMKKAEQNLYSEMLDMKYSDKLQNNSSEISFQNRSTKFEEIKEILDKLSLNELDKGMDVFVEFTKFITDLWKFKLSKISSEEKGTYQGKSAVANLIQTSEYLNPLLDLVESKKIQNDIKDSLFKILKNLLDKSYIEANNAYLELAIGNAPWPIGVTMSGIHNRPGKDKISSKNVAHVLNDETQRKYLQAFKRVMRWCQVLFPTDPSRSVNYNQSDF